MGRGSKGGKGEKTSTRYNFWTEGFWEPRPGLMDSGWREDSEYGLKWSGKWNGDIWRAKLETHFLTYGFRTLVEEAAVPGLGAVGVRDWVGKKEREPTIAGAKLGDWYQP
jgi:hypothetical protein